MNQRLERLIQLHQLKQQAVIKAYQEVLLAKDQFNQHKLKHEQLLGYRQDYMQELEKLGNEGSVIGRLRNRIDFINHLDTALIHLNTRLAQLAKQRTKAEAVYKEAKASEEGVAKLIQRVKNQETIKMQRREQKESDEYAQKQWYSKTK